MADASSDDGADGGAALTRQLSRHGPEYDALIERGIPRRMLRHAWIASGGDSDGAMAFIRANFDQPAEFWAPSEEIAPPTEGSGRAGRPSWAGCARTTLLA